MPVDADDTFPTIFAGAGSVGDDTEMMGVITNLGADSIWRLVFEMPQVLPTGTATLRLLARALATSGAAKVNPKWKSVATGEDPATGALNAETVQTLTWTGSDSDDYLEIQVTLNADTVVADEIIHMDLVFETASWGLAADSGWLASIIWV